MARVVSRVAVAASLLVSLTRAATNATSDVSWCATTDKVALTTCGQGCEACAQYPTKASVTCSDAGRNKCQPSPDNAACTFQCLDLYNVVANKWTLFVKEPKASDAFSTDPTKTKPFPAAPVQIMSGIQVPADAKAIQITGYDAVNVIKGSTVDLTRDDSFFALAKLAETLTITNINLEKLQVNFLPLSLQTLIMDNCKLSDVPSDVGNMPNIRTLNISKNTISELPPVDGKVGKALQSLTALSLRSNSLTKFDFVLPSIQKLDLGDNKLTTFPMAIFNMSKLVTLNLDDNVLQPTNFTTDQFAFLKRLTDTSSLGFSARSCPPGSREDKVLDATVCVVSGASSGSTPTPAATEKSGSSSTVIIIVCAVAGALLLVGGGAFIWHRRRAKTSEFYQSVMENNNSRGTMNATGNTNNSGTSASNYNNSGTGFTNNSGTGQSRPSFFNRSRAPSGGRPSRANSNASSRPSLGHRPSMSAPGNRPSKQSFSGTYSEIAKYQEERQSNAAGTGSMSLVTGGSRQRERAQINQNVVRIASEDINYTRTIAKGAFGEVWLAHYGRDLVAVKKLLSSDPTSVGDFIAELNLLASLSHPRILALVGACWDDSQVDLQIVMEYMDSGDLLTVLRARSPTDLTWEKGKANYCVQVCEAIFYLHSLQPALIHRDIKSRNILIDARKGAKLSDFGESRERTVQNTMTAGVGTARWVAPEIILGEDYSELADIYSLGVLLTELDTHKIPFEGLNLEEHMIVQQVSVGKLRPKVSDSCPEVIRRLVHECLQFDPQLRPSAARVLQTLMASQLVRRLSTISDTEYE